MTKDEKALVREVELAADASRWQREVQLARIVRRLDAENVRMRAALAAVAESRKPR